ncbi:MAG: PIN domain-containing protein [Burkholderiaceae bacterium]
MHLLVDLENVQPSAAEVAAWMGASGRAWIFYAPQQLKLLPGFGSLGERVTLIPISRPGSNSLDFHLVFYLGHLAAKNPEAEFTVLSKDKGYDPAIKHAQMLRFAVKRVAALPAVAKVRPLPIAKKAAPARSAKPTNLAVKKKPVAAPKKVLAKATSKAAAAPVAKKVAQGAAKKKTTPTVQAPQAFAKPVPVKSAAMKALATIYDQVLKDLQGTNRPASLPALERHIQSKIGGTAAPAKVQTLINRLKSAGAIRVADGRLSYVVA